MITPTPTPPHPTLSCVHRKHGRGPGGDYPVHQAGRRERRSGTAAGIQQRGDEKRRRLKLCLQAVIKSLRVCVSPLSSTPPQFAQCFFFDAEERERRKVSPLPPHPTWFPPHIYTVYLFKHAPAFTPLVFLSQPSLPRSLLLSSPTCPPLSCLRLAILLYQLSLIRSPCMLRQIEPGPGGWIKRRSSC